MRNNTIFLYCKGIDDVLTGSSKVAGIQVQMSFWARSFVKHGWNVYSFTDKETRDIEGIHFIKKKDTWLDRHGLSIVQETISIFHYLKIIGPDIVFARAAQRQLFPLEKKSKLFKAKLVFFSACDRDFDFGKELILGGAWNKKLYRKALENVPYFVTQNQYQSDLLLKQYDRSSLILNNIWVTENNATQRETKYDAIWVANLRRLKRAEWFLNLAKQMPDCKFAIVGGVNEKDYYDLIKSEAETLPNVEFLGPRPFEEVNHLLRQSRMLICTSEFEGFPNTFLQAWANEVPVISTVDPSDMIKSFNLGKSIDTEDELFEAFVQIHENDEWYKKCQTDIASYFYTHHDADMAYDKIIHYLEIK